MTHKAVFLVRDNTLIQGSEPVRHPGQLRLAAGAGQSLSLLKKTGYLLVVIAPKPNAAGGALTEKDWGEIHHHLQKLLADEGAYIDGIYCCSFDPQGNSETLRRDSDPQKPAAETLLKAAEDLRIDLSQSWMIGDSFGDIAAGKAAGCQTILLDTPGRIQVRSANAPEPDKRAVNLREAVNIIRMFEFQQKAQTGRAARDLSDDETERSAGRQTPPPDVPAPAAPIPAVHQAAPAAGDTVPDPVAPEQVPPSAATPQNRPNPAAQPTPDPTSHRLLEEILHRVKTKTRYEQYAEFSVFMLLAWLVQALAAFSLVLSIWFWLDQTHGVEAVQTMIGYAVALQLLVIALLLMHDKNK